MRTLSICSYGRLPMFWPGGDFSPARKLDDQKPHLAQVMFSLKSSEIIREAKRTFVSAVFLDGFHQAHSGEVGASSD
jgi:hypothetical protein